jgi:CheY-like chemotaxis protein
MPRPANALIVDDEPHVRVFLRLVLNELGIETIWEAADGGEALDIAEQRQPELILLDINLPVLGGVEVMKQLSATQPETPVVVISSQRSKQTVLDCHQLGAIAYVLKDSSKDETLRILAEALDSLDGFDDAPPGGDAA